MKTYGNIILMTVICIVVFWVFMALRPAHAAQVWVPGSPAWNARAACARQVYRAQIAAGDPRWQRQAARKRAGVDVRTAVYGTADGRSITRSADRYCAARGQ
jgi:hypothetical protein